MTKVLPESDNAELAGLTLLMLVTILRTVDHIPVQAVHHAATIGQTFMQARLGNCSCRGPRASHTWRAGHAAGDNRCVQWRGDHPGCTRLRPGWTSRPLQPLAAALRLPVRLASIASAIVGIDWMGYIPCVSFTRTGWFAQRCRFTPVLHGAGSKRSPDAGGRGLKWRGN
jgi:hypothetical protein